MASVQTLNYQPPVKPSKGENLMPKLTQVTQAQINDTEKLAGHIGELIIGNHITRSGMLVEESYYKDMTTKERREHQLDVLRLQLEFAVKSNQSGKAKEAKELLEMLADAIDHTLIINAIEGVVLGEKTAQEAMKMACDLYRERVSQHDLTDSRYKESQQQLAEHQMKLENLDGRVETLESEMVAIIKANSDLFLTVQEDKEGIRAQLNDIQQQIKPLVKDRVEAELIGALWERIESHPKLVAYCNTIRQALHQRFFKGHFVNAGGAMAGTSLGDNLIKVAAGQIPIVGFLAVAAIEVGIATRDMIYGEIEGEKAKQFVACANSMRALDILPELIALLLTCSYEEQLLCLKPESIISDERPSAASYAILLADKAIRDIGKRSSRDAVILAPSHKKSILGFALAIAARTMESGNRTLKQKIYTDLGFSSIYIADRVNFLLEDEVLGKTDSTIDRKYWTAGSFYYKPACKWRDNENAKLNYLDLEKSNASDYLYRWAIPPVDGKQETSAVRSKTHPYAQKYSELFEHNPFAMVTSVLNNSKQDFAKKNESTEEIKLGQLLAERNDAPYLAEKDDVEQGAPSISSKKP